MTRSLRRMPGGLALATSALLACNAISGLDSEFELAPTVPPSEGGASGTVEAAGGDPSSSSALDGEANDVSTPVDGNPSLDASGQDVQDASHDAPQDAGQDAPQDAGQDAPQDAGQDAPQDAGQDAPQDAGQDAALCPSSLPNVVFCDDFEDTGKSAPLYGWTRRETVAGTPVVESVGAGSRALRANANATSSSAKVVLWQKIRDAALSNGQHIKLAMSFKITTLQMNYAVIGAIQGTGGLGEYGIAVYNTGCPGGNPCIDENDPDNDNAKSNAVPLILDHWYRAEITVTKTSSSYSGTVVLVSGVPSVPTSLDVRASNALPSAGPPFEVGTGVFFTAASPGIEAIVDDVLVQIE